MTKPGQNERTKSKIGNDRCALTLPGCTNCRVDNDSDSGLDPAGDLPQGHLIRASPSIDKASSVM